MTRSARIGGKGWQRLALCLIACALLIRAAIPAGWMPEVQGGHVTLGWCSGMGGAAPAEARALIDKALAGKQIPEHKPAPDQPCAFAAAAHALAQADPVALPAPAAPAPVATYPSFTLYPGHGLVAPPPFATGPPLHA